MFLSDVLLLLTEVCHRRTLSRSVVGFRRLRADDLLLLEAASEEGEHRGQHVVLTPDGGDVVSFIWENLCNRERQQGVIT